MDEKVSVEEYLYLINKYANDQYGEEDIDLTYNDIIPNWNDDEYEPITQRPSFDYYSSCDLTNANEDKIRDRLHLVGNITVDKFSIKITKYTAGTIVDKITKVGNPGPFLTVSIHEKKKKIHQRVNLIKDTRFYGMSWIEHFKNSISSGQDVPLETVVEIIRYLQGVSRLPSFI